VVVRDIDIAFPYDEYGKAMREGERITQLCDSLREVLATRRVALVFVDTHESDAQSLTDLGRKLWEGALAELTDSGLLVIDIFDPGALAGKSSAWPPDPCLVLELPDRYDHDSRADALEDLASIALREGWFPTFDEARASAMTILAVSDNIRDVYAGLAAAVVRLGVGTGVRK